ncbi:MAG TPA: amidohydrolase family protein [Thermoplasmata archaeon]|nr:amidohydrolase family protein [Thermoplasmata archaeon]
MPRRGRLRPGERAAGPGLPPARVFCGRALFRGRLQPVEIAVDDEGRIGRIARSIRGGRRIDVGDRLILPAATDIHVHFREPGGPDPPERFRTGTEAAIAGGVTAVADMPNTDPPIISRERLEEKAARASGELFTDLVVIGAATTADRVRELAKVAGAFKLFLSPTTGEIQPPEPGERELLLRAVADSGLALSVHAEDPRRFTPVQPLTGLVDWDAHRPVDSERSAVEGLEQAPPALRLHIAHVTSAEVADRLRATGHSHEVTPHHLLLSSASHAGTLGKVNPPLRSEAQRRELWERYAAGRIPIVASDHAPHSRDQKDRPFAVAPSGMPGVETLVPILLERVRTGDLPLDVLQRTACDRPARWLGLPHGRIAPGSPAHFLVVDFRERREIRADRLKTACGWSAFEGWNAIFPVAHYRAGELIVDEGETVGLPHGRVVRPDYATARTAEG